MGRSAVTTAIVVTGVRSNIAGRRAAGGLEPAAGLIAQALRRRPSNVGSMRIMNTRRGTLRRCTARSRRYSPEAWTDAVHVPFSMSSFRRHSRISDTTPEKHDPVPSDRASSVDFFSTMSKSDRRSASLLASSKVNSPRHRTHSLPQPAPMRPGRATASISECLDPGPGDISTRQRPGGEAAVGVDDVASSSQMSLVLS